MLIALTQKQKHVKPQAWPTFNDTLRKIRKSLKLFGSVLIKYNIIGYYLTTHRSRLLTHFTKIQYEDIITESLLNLEINLSFEGLTKITDNIVLRGIFFFKSNAQ